MKIFTDKNVKRFFLALTAIMTGFLFLSQLIMWTSSRKSSLLLLFLTLLTLCGILAVCCWYFQKQNKIIETAISKINTYLAGDTDARIECDSESELYKMFHAVNTLAAVLSAHADKELHTKESLKRTISDISHQLKTPLAALNIYNGLLQNEGEDFSAIREFAALSEHELDRMEMLVQNLLKITKLDAGSIVFEKASENVADMMGDIEQHFAYRAKQENKELFFSGSDETLLYCDRDWMIQAISNLVKNSFDHTDAGSHIKMEWKQLASMIQITVADNGKGIDPEDIHHVFKRFYRSHLSKDSQGIGLGLPLAKAIVDAHDGTISVDSILGQGSTFVLLFSNTTKL